MECRLEDVGFRVAGLNPKPYIFNPTLHTLSLESQTARPHEPYRPKTQWPFFFEVGTSGSSLKFLGFGVWVRRMKFYITLRVQVPNHRILPPNLHYNEYMSKIPSTQLLGSWTLGVND